MQNSKSYVLSVLVQMGSSSQALLRSFLWGLVRNSPFRVMCFLIGKYPGRQLNHTDSCGVLRLPQQCHSRPSEHFVLHHNKLNSTSRRKLWFSNHYFQLGKLAQGEVKWLVQDCYLHIKGSVLKDTKMFFWHLILTVNLETRLVVICFLIFYSYSPSVNVHFSLSVQ